MQFNKFTYNVDFIYKDNQIVLLPAFKEKMKGRSPKKITGSRIASVLGKNTFVSPFQAWCDIFGFYKSTPESWFMNAGVVIEPKLVEFVGKELNKKLTQYDVQAERYDVFKNNRIFGGLPDGEEKEGDKVKTIIEIKTASIDKYQWDKKDNEMVLVRDENDNPNITKPGAGLGKWFKNKQIMVPIDYQYQLGLYLYLRNIETGYFCVTFLSFQDYKKPIDFNIKHINYDHTFDENNDIHPSLNKILNNERVIIIEKMTIDLKEFQQVIDYSTKWYEDYVDGEISPPLTSEDKTWFKFGYKDLKNSDD